MEKTITEREAIQKLDKEYADRSREIIQNWKDKKMSSRDGGYTQELKALDTEYYQKLLEIKKSYAKE